MVNDDLVASLWKTPAGRSELENDYELSAFVSLDVSGSHFYVFGGKLFLDSLKILRTTLSSLGSVRLVSEGLFFTILGSAKSRLLKFLVTATSWVRGSLNTGSTWPRYFAHKLSLAAFSMLNLYSSETLGLCSLITSSEYSFFFSAS